MTATPQGSRGGGGPGGRAAALGWGVIEVLGGLALAALLAVTVTDALMRSLLNRPILGGGDMVQVVLALVVAAAIPLSIAAGRAIAIEILIERLSDRVVRPLRRLVAATSAAACAYVAWRCHLNAAEAARFGETTMLLQLPYGPFYRVLSISFALSALVFAAGIVRPQAPR